jgi:aminoglycoside/choline kinase family phosphotransferase
MKSDHPLADRDRWQLVERLVGDASRRSYSRIRDRDGRSVILAEYPDEARQQLRRDIEVLEWCSGRGLRVPAVIDRHLESGWVLLEDLGRDDAEQVMRRSTPQRRAELLGLTLRPLVALSSILPTQLPAWNPPLDGHRLRWELAGFELWFVRHLRGREPAAALGVWLDGLVDEIARHPQRVCHRDYHLNSLFFLADDEVCVIDVQDILVGPDTYDPVSLVAERDTPRLVDEATRRQWLERWAVETGAAAGWEERWPRVRLQRGLKVLGTFARLTVAGLTGYRGWLDALRVQLAAESEALALPPFVTALLLD